MGILLDGWQKEGLLQVVCATCHYYFVCVCVCTPIIRYSMVKEATIQIAKITIRFSTTERKDTLSQLQ